MGKGILGKERCPYNIEYHHFTHITNPFKEKVISPELHRRIIKSFEPGWEDRYSFLFGQRMGILLVEALFCLVDSDLGNWKTVLIASLMYKTLMSMNFVPLDRKRFRFCRNIIGSI
jgi:hypothetical protein